MTQFRPASAVIVTATLLLFCGCASLHVSAKSYAPGRILVLPPRDLVQSAVPHPKGAGSGQVFQNYLKTRFAESPFVLLTTDSTQFSGLEIASKEQCLNEARRMDADYCLQVVLGEFQNAAPMTFRPDYVYLDRAMLYSVRSGEIVWQLAEPFRVQKGNIGNHLKLLDELAGMVSISIIENARTTP